MYVASIMQTDLVFSSNHTKKNQEKELRSRANGPLNFLDSFWCETDSFSDKTDGINILNLKTLFFVDQLETYKHSC